MPKPKVLIVSVPNIIAPADWNELSSIADVTYLEKETISSKELLESLAGYEYLMLNYDVVKELDENFYREVKERDYPLRAISTDITGMSWADVDSASRYDIMLMNTPGYSTISVAEFIFALLLLHVKELAAYYEEGAPKNFKERKNGVLYEKTLGIVGLGRIGRRVAEIAAGFDMNVVAWNRTSTQIAGVESLKLEQVFERADYISINLETNQETIGMVDNTLLSLLKPGTIIINEADGKIVDNTSLITAMESGRVAVYAATHKAAEGTPALLARPEFKPVPSQAWFTDHALAQLREIWTGNVIAAIKNEPQNVVT